MSRIHDALKRAEQDRATSLGGHVEPVTEVAEPQPVAVPSPSLAATAVMSTLTSTITYETLLARCPQSQWSPDSRSMLFFDNEENRAGAEEFHSAFATLPDSREAAPEEANGHKRAAEGREVIRFCESSSSDGQATWAPGAGDRCRSAQPGNAPSPWCSAIARIGRISDG